MIVNGKKVSLSKRIVLEQFLNEQNFRRDRIVVELNGNILSSGEISNIYLKDDDIIEVVSFVGGGCGRSSRERLMDLKKER